MSIISIDRQNMPAKGIGYETLSGHNTSARSLWSFFMPTDRRQVDDIGAAEKIMRRVLKRGNYSTADLGAAAGPDHRSERTIIERIQTGMIMSDVYPVSKQRKVQSNKVALRRWENEGGSTDEGDQ
ncbi:hypothetical protein [Rhizobium sp. SL86]|uniref:hypothetical protein n=1 Tax=Rhizobium sp. SL86 TaxID=2995148 RepID=UPI0022743541|nr:hypothetical protein [Rhizobium sp. SL86]MCY1667690.1 hypothetical protein [Rhizobium sp. SL86]